MSSAAPPHVYTVRVRKMKNMRLAGFALLLAVALGSCTPWRPFPPPAPSPVPNWTVVLTQSGGFAGVNLVVRVEGIGTITAEDMRRGIVVTKQLPDTDMHELERLLSAASLDRASRVPSGCADCFLYDLEITALGKTSGWRGDDTTLASSGADDLIRFLGALRDGALAGGV